LSVCFMDSWCRMNGNINALFLRNNGGQDVELSGDNSVALNAVLKR
jgi:hypothetical protein